MSYLGGVPTLRDATCCREPGVGRLNKQLRGANASRRSFLKKALLGVAGFWPALQVLSGSAAAVPPVPDPDIIDLPTGPDAFGPGELLDPAHKHCNYLHEKLHCIRCVCGQWTYHYIYTCKTCAKKCTEVYHATGSPC